MWLRRVVSMLALGVLVTSCVGAPPARPAAEGTEPKYGGTFIYSARTEPETLNPNLSVNYEIQAVTANIYNGLLRQNLDLSVRPSLAERWDISADGKTYTFHLVKGVKWHDGKPFTSADVKFTIERVVLPYHGQGKAQFGVVESIQTPDDNTVVFRLKQPFPPIMQYLTVDGASIMPKHLLEGTEILKNNVMFAPVGTGPFRLKEWVRGDHITLERNPDYWDKGKPYLDRVIVRFQTDPNARVLSLEAGEVSYITGYLPYSEYDRFSKDPKYKTTLEGSERLASIATNLCFNLTHPIFKIADVRRAFAYALDRKLIVDKAAFGIGEIATTHIPSFVAWAHSKDAPRYPYDRTKAEALLDAAGYPKDKDGIRMRVALKWNTNDAEHSKSAEVIQQLLGDVGVRVTLAPLEPGAYNEQIFLKWDYELVLRGIGTGPDPGVSALWRSYHTTNIAKTVGQNFMQYSNTSVDDWFNKAAIEADQGKRAAYFKQIQNQLMTDLPSIPIRERVEPKVWHAYWRGEVVAGPGQGLTNSWDSVWRQ